MKKKLLFCALIFLSLHSFAQEEEEEEKERGFKKDRLFTGGSLSLGFSNQQTLLGILPHFGYSVNKFLDVAVSMNVNYISTRDYPYYGDKVRELMLGPGGFIRLFPLKFLYAEAQYEHNFIRFKYLPLENSGQMPFTDRRQANSFLVGGGYCGGREAGNTFYYFSIMWDVGKDPKSPYVDELGRSIPIIRAGFNIALFQGGQE